MHTDRARSRTQTDTHTHMQNTHRHARICAEKHANPRETHTRAGWMWRRAPRSMQEVLNAHRHTPDPSHDTDTHAHT